MTYVNHRDTETTETHTEFFGISRKDLCAASVFSVSLWLTSRHQANAPGIIDSARSMTAVALAVIW